MEIYLPLAHYHDVFEILKKEQIKFEGIPDFVFIILEKKEEIRKEIEWKHIPEKLNHSLLPYQLESF